MPHSITTPAGSTEAAIAVLLEKSRSTEEKLERLAEEIAEIKTITVEIRLIQERMVNLSDRVSNIDTGLKCVRKEMDDTSDLINKGKGAAWLGRIVWGLVSSGAVIAFSMLSSRISDIPTKKDIEAKDAVIIKRIENIENLLSNPSRDTPSEFNLTIPKSSK